MSVTTDEANKSLSLNSVHPCCRFSLAEIQTATRSFDEELVIGHGGFGKVYKGFIFSTESSHTVAVKRLDSMSNQGAPEFRAEIEMLTKLRHCHLVSLIGFCDDNKEMILVYDYMPNGTLHDNLHKSKNDIAFNWVQRLKIAIGAARGLDYLHTGVGTQHGVIHRDIKSSNILLDENWGAKISDFGLSKLGPINQSSSYIDASVKGTFGYLDPEYYYTRRITRKTDVYAFGVVLFELLSGRLPVDERYGEEDCSLVRWAQKIVKERKLDQLVDSSIRGTISPKILKQFAQIAYRCILGVPKERPPTTEVVASLQNLLEIQNKCDVSSESSGIMGFTWKIHKYLVLAPKQNSDETGTSNMNQQEESVIKDVKMFTRNMNQQEESVIKDVKMFTYNELQRATSDKSLGWDSYGKFYKGWIDKRTYSPSKGGVGLPIVVRKIHHYEHFDPEMLKEFRHPNLVHLIGYCLESEQLFLVHEFMHNGNFQDLLRKRAIAQLPLVTKVKIALGIARGIVFLHQTGLVADESLLDRRKILLDEDFVVKFSDYDIDGHFSRVWEDLDDYYYPGFQPLQLRSDIFGFAVIFAEVITGEQIPNFNKMEKIERFFKYCGKNHSIHEIAKKCFKSCNEVDSE